MVCIHTIEKNFKNGGNKKKLIRVLFINNRSMLLIKMVNENRNALNIKKIYKQLKSLCFYTNIIINHFQKNLE